MHLLRMALRTPGEPEDGLNTRPHTIASANTTKQDYYCLGPHAPQHERLSKHPPARFFRWNYQLHGKSAVIQSGARFCLENTDSLSPA